MTNSAAIGLSLGPRLILGLLAAKGPLFRMSRMIRSGPRSRSAMGRIGSARWRGRGEIVIIGATVGSSLSLPRR